MDSLRRQVVSLIENPSARRDPRPLYDRLLTEAPVLFVGQAWVVSGFAEIEQVLRHPGVGIDPTAIGLPRPMSTSLSRLVGSMLPMRDGQDHTRLKRLATPWFSHRRIAALRERVEAATDLLLLPCLESGEFDYVADLARPLPVALSLTILDIPVAEQGRVHAWSRLLVRALQPDLREEDAADVEAGFAELQDYVLSLCGKRERVPGEDLISELVVAHKAGQITADELLAFVVLLLTNGVETLTAGLSVAAWEVLQRPHVLDLIRRRPEVAEAVFDEALRLGSPVRAGARVLTQAVDLGTVQLPARSVALTFYAAANRDPRRFTAPDEIDVERPDPRHLAFGHGPHHCLGAPLSLMVGGHILRQLALRCQDVATSVTGENVHRSERFVMGGLTSLPMTCTSRRAVAAPR